MTRYSGSARSKPLYCQHCDCGNHRGCTQEPPPPHTFRSTPRSHVVYREPQFDCPCIIEDDRRIAELEEEEKKEDERLDAVKVEENILRCRVAAIEKELWGRTFEGTSDLFRPQSLQAKDTSFKVSVTNEQERPSQASKRRRSNSI
jgi:hypothetical protein